MPPTNLPPEPRSTFVLNGALRLHVSMWGDPDAPPLLLLHGMRDQARSWDWTAAAFLQDHLVIAPDLRGHGDSGWASPEAYSLAAFVLDLACVVNALAPSPLALVGHSLGGHLALRFAATYPEQVRALYAIEAIELPIVRDQRRQPRTHPTRLSEWIEAEGIRRGRAPRTYASPEEAELHLRRAQPTLDADTISHLCRHALVGDIAGRWRWKYDPAARARPPDDAGGENLDETLAAIACPTMLAYGGESWIPLPPPERLALIRKHRLELFPGASHWLHHQSRGAFLSTLSRFLQPGTD